MRLIGGLHVMGKTYNPLDLREVFKMKKGDIEIELKSDDIEFVEEQLNKWRADIMQKQHNLEIRGNFNAEIHIYI